MMRPIILIIHVQPPVTRKDVVELAITTSAAVTITTYRPAKKESPLGISVWRPVEMQAISTFGAA
jgi:hypothetical protein